MWIALGLGLYIVVLSVSGSAVVFRRELTAWLVPRTVPSTEGERLTGDALLAAVHSAVPRRTPSSTCASRGGPSGPSSVVLERDGVRNGAAFRSVRRPRSRRDVSADFCASVEWLVDLHDNLLAGQTGRMLNGIGGIFFTVLIVTGAWLWWPGVRNVSRSLKVGRPRASRRFIWQLHSVLGILSFALTARVGTHGDLLRVSGTVRGHDRLTSTTI